MAETSPYICSTCRHQFARSYDLKRHIERVHTAEKTIAKIYECPICHKFFKTNSYIKTHCKTVHCISQYNPVSTPTSGSTPVPTEKLVEYFKERDEQLIERIKKEVIESLNARDETLKKELTEILDARNETLKNEVIEKIQRFKPPNNVM